MKTTGSVRLLLLISFLLSQPAAADLFTAGLAYDKGDYEKSFKDYRELAELGHPIAQFNIAVMYAKGQGVPKSDPDAYAWALIAVDNGQDRAKLIADALRSRITPDAQKTIDNIRAQFGRAVLDERLMPKIELGLSLRREQGAGMVTAGGRGRHGDLFAL